MGIGKVVLIGRGSSKRLITKLFLDETAPLLAEIEDLKGKNETLKSLLRTAEEALRKETDNHHFYRGLYSRTEKELNAIAKFTDLTER